MVNEPFEVHLTSQAEKDLKDLRPWQRRVIQELLALEDDPVKGHVLRGSLAGVRSLEFSLPGGLTGRSTSWRRSSTPRPAFPAR